MNTNKNYIQFSKKIVTMVCISVTVITILSIILSYLGGTIDRAYQIMTVYIEFAMVVFVAYSGNSTMQKWILSKQRIANSENG